MKRSHKFRLFSNLTFENINNTFEATGKGGLYELQPASLVRQENCGRKCLTSLHPDCYTGMSSPELRLASLKIDVACVQIPLPSGKVGVCMGIILHKFKK